MELLEKIKDKKALGGITGLGSVGLPLVLRFTEVGQDFFLVFSPEREDPGNAEYEVKVLVDGFY